jgi:hypothetical protein
MGGQFSCCTPAAESRLAAVRDELGTARDQLLAMGADVVAKQLTAWLEATCFEQDAFAACDKEFERMKLNVSHADQEVDPGTIRLSILQSEQQQQRLVRVIQKNCATLGAEVAKQPADAECAEKRPTSAKHSNGTSPMPLPFQTDQMQKVCVGSASGALGR